MKIVIVKDPTLPDGLEIKSIGSVMEYFQNKLSSYGNILNPDYNNLNITIGKHTFRCRVKPVTKNDSVEYMEKRIKNRIRRVFQWITTVEKTRKEYTFLV